MDPAILIEASQKWIPLTNTYTGIWSEYMIVNTIDISDMVIDLEHVVVSLDIIPTKKRGDITVTLFSPSKTPSILMNPRKYDYDTSPFTGWQITTVRCWGENPNGKWTLTIENGKLQGWKLGLYGGI